MKIQIYKTPLENILNNFQAFLDKRDQSNITSHILFRIQDQQLLLRATDFEMGIQSLINVISIQEEGEGTVNGKEILGIIKQLKDEKEITFETKDDELIIKQDRASFKLPMFNSEEFPKFPSISEENKINIPTTNFIEAIKKISPAVANNNTKIELNGANLDIKEYAINFVSTDTKRLALVKMETQSISTLSIIIPKRALLEISKLFSNDFEIYYNQSQLILVADNYSFFTKLTNGRFPDYERIIPKTFQYSFTLNKSKMMASLKMIQSLAQEVKITFNQNEIIFESFGNGNSHAEDRIEANNSITEPIQIAASLKSILDFLGQIDNENFELCIAEKTTPFLLRDNNFLTIIMPINL